MGTNATIAPVTMKIELSYNGTITSQTITVAPSNPYLFDIAKNENYDYTGRVIYADGTFTCIKFTTYPTVTP